MTGFDQSRGNLHGGKEGRRAVTLVFVAVTGERIDGINAIREMLMEAPGTQYSFVVERQTQVREFKLKLANLY